MNVSQKRVATNSLEYGDSLDMLKIRGLDGKIENMTIMK